MLTWTYRTPEPDKPHVFHALGDEKDYPAMEQIILWARGQFDLEGNTWLYLAFESNSRRMSSGLLGGWYPDTPDTTAVSFVMSFNIDSEALEFKLTWT
jgi:hypothetical protein